MWGLLKSLSSYGCCYTFQIAESDCLWLWVSSGCHRSMMSTMRDWLFGWSCHTSWSKESSKTKMAPSCHDKYGWSATLNLERLPGGTLRPRWALKRQLVGPEWGWTWVPASITLNLTWPLLLDEISGIVLMREQVVGALLQLALLGLPCRKSSNWDQWPLSWRLSPSLT